MNDTSDSQVLPLLPLRNTVLFPYVLLPVSIGRSVSVSAVEAAVAGEDKLLAVVAQKDDEVEVPGQDDLYAVGTKAVIRRMVRGEDTVEIILQGVERVRLVGLDQSTPYLTGKFVAAPVPDDFTPEIEALQRELIALSLQFQSLGRFIPEVDLSQVVSKLENPMHLVYLLGMMIGLEMEKAQQLLEAPGRVEAMRMLHEFMTHELKVAKVRHEIAGQASTEIGREQREYLLRQQLRAIQQELGELSPEQSAVQELRKRLDETELPEEIRKEVERELGRLANIPAASPDYQVTRTYLELVLELPWNKFTEDNLDLKRARHILDEDHYGLEDIKERILEHLAVLKLNPQAKAPILCFVGPPGVGKTSLGQSIARSLGRKFERFSLGGLHDEAELRGHRRTYIGAMPGRIIQAIRRAGVANPLLMLDEVDKLGRDFRGDPAAALLEILDPVQNFEFRDNYLDLPFDLSKTFFITTANTLDTIPRPLLDRMEILRLSGYSDEEKLQIATRYLLERQRQQAGLTDEQFVVPEETIMAVIHDYTREAGVRELERTLGRLARKVALRFAEQLDVEQTGKSPPRATDGQIETSAPRAHTESVVVRPEDLAGLLGPKRFFLEQARKELPPGVATGLAWTETGGDVLYIEAIKLPRGEKLTLTGKLGKVMQESARAARNYIVSRAQTLGIERPSPGAHIHVPAGAIPKDGPSAGVAIAAAIASMYTGDPVRPDTAMTGEITLSGLVLPVGGIKEKVLAARRAGIHRVILPADNEKDLSELPEEVRRDMEIILVRRIEEVLTAAIPQLEQRLHAVITV